MNDNTKMELAREIMNAMIGKVCKNGFNRNDEFTKTLLEEEKEMNNFNLKVIDKIIKVYGPQVK
ncbi:MAG: hypothetical protein ACI4PF_05635 [Christensenellales bacterium]